MKLFDKTSETIEGPSDNNENPFNYYHKSTRGEMRIIRNTLEKWFFEYPESEKLELKNRFKKDMDSSFYELFLFTLFKKLGFNVEIHPELKHTKKRPDFLLIKKDLRVYVEAKICYDKSEKEMAFERRQNQFYDNLSKVKIKGFFLKIEELKFKTDNQPSVKKLIAKIEDTVAELDAKEISMSMEKYGFDGCPRIEFENKDIEIVIQPMPLIESQRNRITEQPIGMFPFKAFWGGGEESLRDSILRKANRYGKFDTPYLICINSLGEKTSGKVDIENTIWGSLKYTYSTNPASRDGKMTRVRDGVFYNSGKSKLTNVSGVFVTKVFPSNIPSAKYWLFENPLASNSFDFDKLGLVYNYVRENQITSFEGFDLYDKFEIPLNWLTKEALLTTMAIANKVKSD